MNRTLLASVATLFLFSCSLCGIQPAAKGLPPRFRALVLTEVGGQHGPFVEAAKAWLKRSAEVDRFDIDYVENTDRINDAFLAQYQVFIQLNFSPYGWRPAAMAAFRDYIEKGKGGWVGLHHATLLGEFDGYPMWPWFSEFMGKIQYENYIPTFVAGTVHAEDRVHPCMKGVPSSFVVAKEEWYTYNRSPRPNVRVLASVDESSYAPSSDKKMGDHPVIWTNEHVAARNIYIFMGHGADLFKNKAYTTLLHNSILWAAGR